MNQLIALYVLFAICASSLIALFFNNLDNPSAIYAILIGFVLSLITQKIGQKTERMWPTDKENKPDLDE